jgi:hypothetical protein
MLFGIFPGCKRSFIGLTGAYRAQMVAKPKLRWRASSPNRERYQRRSSRSASIFDRPFYLLFLFLPFVTLIQTVLARQGEHTFAPGISSETVISGRQWSYTVPFAVRNKATQGKLPTSRTAQTGEGGRNADRADVCPDAGRSAAVPQESGGRLFSGVAPWAQGLRREPAADAHQ